jgi:hypothetical protein
MADFYRYRPLPALPRGTRDALLQMGRQLGQAGATHFRYTIVSDDTPVEGYPNGIYVQGWLETPADDAFEFPAEQIGE